MTPAEKQIFLSVPSNEFNTYWIPCTWFIHVLKDVKEDNPNLDPVGLKLIMEVSTELLHVEISRAAEAMGRQ